MNKRKRSAPRKPVKANPALPPLSELAELDSESSPSPPPRKAPWDISYESATGNPCSSRSSKRVRAASAVLIPRPSTSDRLNVQDFTAHEAETHTEHVPGYNPEDSDNSTTVAQAGDIGDSDQPSDNFVRLLTVYELSNKHGILQGVVQFNFPDCQSLHGNVFLNTAAARDSERLRRRVVKDWVKECMQSVIAGPRMSGAAVKGERSIKQEEV